jgi:voltage-gated potassium channel Kch
VIVAGYGQAGRAVCQALREAGIPYVATDVNPDNVRAARAAGDRAVLGDVTQREVLEALGCKDARLVVISINDPRATELGVRTIRRESSELPLIVRVQYELDKGRLHAAGATRVITAEATASEALVSASVAALSSDVRPPQPRIDGNGAA